jgi:hypothetical protein
MMLHMSAPRLAICFLAVIGLPALAHAGPKVTKKSTWDMDDRAKSVLYERAQLTGEAFVLRDQDGGIFIAYPFSDNREVFFGTPEILYLQRSSSSSSDGDGWSMSTWSPRVPGVPLSTLQAKKGKFEIWCGNEKPLHDLVRVTGDEAKKIVENAKLMTSAIHRIPVSLARDDRGVYYYVDRISKTKNYRVFVGKRNSMKITTLTDVADDSLGQVFSTKDGSLRLVNEAGSSAQISWVKGKKSTKLSSVDPEANMHLIYRDLGIYTFLGTPCDDL